MPDHGRDRGQALPWMMLVVAAAMTLVVVAVRLAVVVDDHLMEITHILRGEEWINSVPKHQLLYEYFGWEMPVLCHLPLLRNPDQSKLSKRKNPTSVNYYRRIGVLPEALVNYLGHMAWTMPDERDVFELQDMVDAFELERISLGGPVFAVPKLSALNGRWLRERNSPEEFAQRVMDWKMNLEFMQKLVPLVQPRVQRFTDLV